ncbi:MAG: HAMP domain-containing sensor histidine kinase [Gemmatimonadota bacterium]
MSHLSDPRILLDASSILDSSLDWVEGLRRLADLVSPALSDWCCLDILEPGEPPRRICGAGGRPDRDPLLRELEADFPLDPDSPHPAALTIRTGQPVIMENLSPPALARYGLKPRHLEILGRVGVSSGVSVPITARGRVLGAMTLVQVTHTTVAEDTVLVARELGQRAGLSIANAMLYRDAQAASKAKSDFLAVMSHELRTPLNSILGYVDLIQAGIGGPVTDEQGAHLSRIRISSRHLLQIIDEILTYSRMDAGRETLRVEPVELAGACADVVALAEPLARERGLEFRIDPVPEATLLTDPQKIRQILLNLLTNAVKFTDTGWVKLAAGVSGECCVFEVSDSGRGIAGEDLQRVFEPFWQVEQARTRSRGGTGLGLAVSRRLCQLLGGDLSVSSEPGSGATFRAAIALKLDPEAAGGGRRPVHTEPCAEAVARTVSARHGT